MRFLVLQTIALIATATIAAAGEPPKLERVSIATDAGDRVFKVEVVREEAERNKGLMFRKSLADDAGMLFDYDPPQAIAFWMKNTYIPLDIIFIEADGRILTIAENTTPLSLERIPSGGVVRAVLEVKGGTSARLGIKVGDRVHYRWFDEAR